MNNLIFSNKDFSSIIDGNNFNTIESLDNYDIVISSKDKSINFVTNNDSSYTNNLQIKNNNIYINSNLNLSENSSINNLKFNNFISEDNNVSSGTIINSKANSSLYLGINGDDNKDSFNILFKQNNQFNNLFCIKHNGIGINNSKPESELDVNGCMTTKELFVKNDKNTSIKFNQNSNFKIGLFLENENLILKNNTENILNLVHEGEYSGNIGIGTNNPVTKLDINSSSIRIRNESILEPSHDTVGNIGEIRWSKNAIFILTDIIDNKYLWKKAILNDI